MKYRKFILFDFLICNQNLKYHFSSCIGIYLFSRKLHLPFSFEIFQIFILLQKSNSYENNFILKYKSDMFVNKILLLILPSSNFDRS